MIRNLWLAAALAAGALCAAPPSPAGKGRKADERITEEQLLQRDKLIRYTSLKPCWLDKYRYFCCPVRKIVRRSAGKDKWVDYCYNSREELIGSRTHSHGQSVRRSDFKSIGGCTLCGNTAMKSRRWTRDYNPKLAPPKKKRK